MKWLWAPAICAMAVNGWAWAGDGKSNTAIGTGVGIAKSNSQSNAVAISGQGGNGGAVIINPGPAATTSSNTSTINNTGHSSISTVPSVFAPGLAAAGIESCLGSVSGGGSWLGTGISLGGSIPDADCSARLDARTLWSFGLKKAAVARLCLEPAVYRSMPDICTTYAPVPVGYAPAAVSVPYGGVPYFGGDIWLVEGKTGRDRLCRDYDSTRKRCRLWADVSQRASR